MNFKFAKLVTLFTFIAIPHLSKASIYEPQTLWDKNTVKVCFYDRVEQIALTEYGANKKQIEKQGFTPAFFSQIEKEFIKNTVKKNYNKNDTGITFTGWENCSITQDFDTVIIKAEGIRNVLWFTKKPDFAGRASVGEQGLYSSEGFLGKDLSIKSSVVLNNFQPKLITHEFGHLTGLRHEHVHPNAAQVDDKCMYAILPEVLHTAIIQNYDPSSIMNYCRLMKKSDDDGSLSEKDKILLRALYSNKKS